MGEDGASNKLEVASATRFVGHEDQEPGGGVPGYLMTDVDAGLRLVLNL